MLFPVCAISIFCVRSISNFFCNFRNGLLSSLDIKQTVSVSFKAKNSRSIILGDSIKIALFLLIPSNGSRNRESFGALVNSLNIIILKNWVNNLLIVSNVKEVWKGSLAQSSSSCINISICDICSDFIWIDVSVLF